MANTTKYLVATEQGTEEFSNLGLVGKFLGKKLTKADVLAGKYPMVTLEQVEEPTLAELSGGAVIDVADLEPTEEDTILVPADGAVDEEPIDEGIEVPDDSTGFLPDPELDAHTLQVLTKVEEAINATPEDNTELFDGLCDLEDAIRDRINLTDAQATLLTQVLTDTLGANDNTVDTGSEDEDEEIVTAPVSDTEYPEVGDFKDEKAIKKYIKGLSDKSLEEWCILEGAEWKHNDHESINRMRMAMAIKALHFPTTAPTKSKKSKSKYASYETEDLVAMALEHDIEVPDDKGDNRILRMYTIMALRKAGLID